jgi:RimJ/RimL family protein N-acetyltransferase
VSAAPVAPGTTVEVLTADAVRALADGRRETDWHSDFPAETDVALARLALVRSEWGDPVILAIRADAAVVGTIALTPRGEEPDGWEVGYHVIEAARGRGIATAALTAAMRRWQPLTAETDPANTASIRVLTDAGFRSTESDDPAVLRWESGR